MARHCWKWLLGIGLILLLVWGYDRVQRVLWVGHTDLLVEFVVVEAGSEQPIPGARIDVHSQGGYDEREEQKFHLLTDASGTVRKECRGCLCSGARSGLGFTDTYSVRLPWWHFQVSADGFEPTEWMELPVPEISRRVRRGQPDKVVVRVSLQRRRS
jgi:hypothetical protein